MKTYIYKANFIVTDIPNEDWSWSSHTIGFIKIKITPMHTAIAGVVLAVIRIYK